MPKQTPKWYSIRVRASAPRAPEVFIYGDIGASWDEETTTAADFVKEIAALDVDTLTVRINSIGGSVPDGIAIYNALKRHTAAVTVAIDGMALSIASLIAMAGDSVEMAENAMLMIHAPWTYAAGNSAQMRDQADVLDKWAAAMSTSYANKTGKAADEILALLTDGVDHYYTATEALADGFVDTVVAAMPVSASAAIDATALSRFRSLPIQAKSIFAALAVPVKEQFMPGAITPAAQEPAAKTETEIRAAALAADAARRSDIKALFAKHQAHEGAAALLAACEADHECSAEQAGLKLLAHLGATATPIAGSRVVTVEDETDKFRAAVVQSIQARAASRDDKGQAIHADPANPYRGHSLLDLARVCLARAGVRTEGMDKMQIVAAAFTQSTSDFPVLLENTLHKTLQQSYLLAADTWTRFCAIGTVSDFRAHPRYRVGSLGNLDALSELGEFKNKTIPDGEKASITAGTKGNIINISRQTVINDDLGAFVGLASMLGRAAKRTIEADVYASLALNSGLGPVMSDGKTLFHADHGNISVTGAMSVAVFDDVRVKMSEQKDVSGNDYLDLRPAVLLVPTAMKGDAIVINGAEYDPDTANKLQRPNKVRGQYSDIVDTPRLSGTRFYSLASAMDAPVLEVDSALSSRIDTVQASLGNSITTVQQKSEASASAINGLYAKWSVKTQVMQDGQYAVAGVELLSGVPGQSVFAVLADRFLVYQPNGIGAPKQVLTMGTVNGVTALGFDGSAIFDGSITARQINGTGLKITGEVNVGGYTGYFWPPAGQTGAHLSAQGFLAGNANGGGKYFQIYTPAGDWANARINTNIPAYLGDLSVDTIHVKNGAITTTTHVQGANILPGMASGWTTIASAYTDIGSGTGSVSVHASCFVEPASQMEGTDNTWYYKVPVPVRILSPSGAVIAEQQTLSSVCLIGKGTQTGTYYFQANIDGSCVYGINLVLFTGKK